MTPMEIGVLSGLLEGEGSFRFQRRRGVIVQFTTTDLDIAEREARHLGVNVWGPYRDKHRKRKPYWQVRVCSAHAVGLMLTVYKFLGARRREQIRSSLAEWKKIAGVPTKIWRNAERKAA